MKKGLIHLYHGNGKGKTTAAMGLILRASGYNVPVVLVQFLKNSQTGELEPLKGLDNVTVLRGKEGAPFSFSMTEKEKQRTKEIHNDNLRQAIDLVRERGKALLVLDEVLDAYNLKLIDEELLKGFVEGKPEQLELVMTGRNPAPFMVAEADYITHMVKEKHPFDEGITAREGIEY